MRVLSWQKNTSTFQLFLKETVLKTTKIIATVATFAVASVLSVGVVAKAATDKNASIKTAAPQAAEMTSGEVRKIDKEAGKLTLKHGKIKNLDMPGMTMVFTIRDKSLLDNLQVGDKIKFKAINDKGKLTVTDIQDDNS
jgi:Cu(I)/Ag(I) efflux system periplasmic protein CusF